MTPKIRKLPELGERLKLLKLQVCNREKEREKERDLA